MGLAGGPVPVSTHFSQVGVSSEAFDEVLDVGYLLQLAEHESPEIPLGLVLHGPSGAVSVEAGPEGGMERLVWLPKAVKERVPDAFPEGFAEKVATEEDATDIESLKAFLKEKDHPVVQRWKEAPPEEPEVVPVGAPAPTTMTPTTMTPTTMAAVPAGVIAAPTITLPIMLHGGATGGGNELKLILNNVRININKVYLKKDEE